jgi:hypothetical protein
MESNHMQTDVTGFNSHIRFILLQQRLETTESTAPVRRPAFSPVTGMQAAQFRQHRVESRQSGLQDWNTEISWRHRTHHEGP